MSKLGSMSDKVMGDCERCGRPVRENHSHITTAPVASSGCTTTRDASLIRDKPNIAKDKTRDRG